MYVVQNSLAEHLNPKAVGGGMFRAQVPAVLLVYPQEGDPDPLDYDIEIGLDVIDGRLSCTSCKIQMRDGGAAINAEALRRVPVARYLREAVSNGMTVVEIGEDGVELGKFEKPPANFAKDGPTDEVLRQVARLYHWALVTGEAPLGLLEREYGIPRGKASRWIAIARRRKFVKDEEQTDDD